MESNITIRLVKPSDKKHIWKIIQKVILKGDTYVFDPSSSRESMMTYWFSPSHHVFVAEIQNVICGTYILKDNQPDLGSHVANASYMVGSDFQGKGIGETMGRHSIDEAKKIGYKAIQFNLVIKSNLKAIKLWKKLGFRIIGEIPEAFNHPKLGLTNAYIMHKSLGGFKSE